MGQRSTLCTHQMLDLGLEQSDSCLHSGHSFFTGNTSDYASRNIIPSPSGPGNSVDRHYERIMLYGSQYNNQSCHAIQSVGVGALGPANFYNSNMLLAPASRNFSTAMAEQAPSSINQIDNGVNMDEFGIHSHLVDLNRRPCKRKDTEMIPGIFYNLNESTSSSSIATFHAHGGVPLWGQLYESMPGIMDQASFSPLEYERRVSLQVAEGFHRSMRDRSITGSVQPESTALRHHNCVLPSSYMIHPLHSVNNAWVPQFGNGNNIVDGGVNWNCQNTLRYLQGRSLNTGRLHQPSTSMQAYTSNSSVANPAMLLHQSPMPNFHPAFHNMQVHSYSNHAHIPAPYQNAVNSLGSVNSHLSDDGMDVRSPFPHLPTGADQIYRPLQAPQPAQQIFSGSLRLLSVENPALRELSEYYGVGSAIDQHEDMRLDIDDMSYEELLALEEQIGVVKTGLAEDFITKHLKMRAHVPLETALSLQPSSRLSVDNDRCSICQVEYEEDEIIGTLDCGHEYHADCIKQWLLIKNLCPVCKTSALAKKEG